MKVLNVAVKNPSEYYRTPFKWKCAGCDATNHSKVLASVVQYGVMNGVPTHDVVKACSECGKDNKIELSIP